MFSLPSEFPPSSRYPAGFVYIYLVLYYITNLGANIRLAQLIFAAFYLVVLYLVFRVYRKTNVRKMEKCAHVCVQGAGGRKEKKGNELVIVKYADYGCEALLKGDIQSPAQALTLS